MECSVHGDELRQRFHLAIVHDLQDDERDEADSRISIKAEAFKADLFDEEVTDWNIKAPLHHSLYVKMKWGLNPIAPLSAGRTAFWIKQENVNQSEYRPTAPLI